MRVITRYGGDRFSFAVESKATYYGGMYFRLSVSSGQAAEITDAKVTLPESADTMLICGLPVSGNVIDLGGKVFDKGDEMTCPLPCCRIRRGTEKQRPRASSRR